MNNSKLAEKSISERFSDLWGELSHNQRRYVVAYQDCTNKAEAAKAIEIKPDTVYRWPDIVDEAAELLAGNIKDAAAEILAHALAKAAAVKVAGLDSGDERVRQDAASEIIERYFGKATQPLDVSGDVITVTIVDND